MTLFKKKVRSLIIACLMIAIMMIPIASFAVTKASVSENTTYSFGLYAAGTRPFSNDCPHFKRHGIHASERVMINGSYYNICPQCGGGLPIF